MDERRLHPTLRALTDTEQLYVPELVPVTERTRELPLMTRPWLDWARRVTGLLKGGGGNGGGAGDVVGPSTATNDAIAIYNGTTGKIIKDSLKTIANVISDAVNQAIAAILPGGKLPAANLPENVAVRDTANTFTAMPQRIETANPQFHLYDTNGLVDARLFRLSGAGGNLLFRAMSDNNGILQSTPLTLERDGDAIIGRDLYEKGRAYPLGHWKNVPFNASDYAASAGLTWSIASNHVLQNMYTLIGDTMIWSVSILNATLTGTSAAELYILVPDAIPIVAYSGNEKLADARSGASGPINAVAYVPNTYIALAALSPAAWPAGAGSVVIKFTVILPLQLGTQQLAEGLSVV